MNKLLVQVAILTVACGAAFSAQAGEKLQFSSIAFGTSATVTKMQLDGSNTYGIFLSDELVVSLNMPDSHPLQNLSGKCGGVSEKTAGGVKAGGHCVYSNLAGGKFSLNFVVDPSLKPDWAGTFEMTGIEGNATGWKVSCKWSPAVDFPDQRYVSRWSCSAEKP